MSLTAQELAQIENRFFSINEIELQSGVKVRFSNYSVNKNGQIALNPGTYNFANLTHTFSTHTVIKPHKVGKISKVNMADDNGTQHEINVAHIVASKWEKRTTPDLADIWQNYAINKDMNCDDCMQQNVKFYLFPKAKTLAEAVRLMRTKKIDPWDNQMVIKMEAYLRDIVYIETGEYPQEDLPLEKEPSKVVPLKTNDPVIDSSITHEDVNTALEPTKEPTFSPRKSSVKMTVTQESAIAIAYFKHRWTNRTTLAGIAGVTDSTVSKFIRGIEQNPHKLRDYGLDSALVKLAKAK